MRPATRSSARIRRSPSGGGRVLASDVGARASISTEMGRATSAMPFALKPHDVPDERPALRSQGAAMTVDVRRLEIQLLGPPRIVLDGQTGRSPRGWKAWALLTFLLLSPRPVSRERLASLLFADADDPLGAVRWNLAELRRSLGTVVRLEGDPVALMLPVDVLVDVHVIGRGTWLEAVRVPGLGHDLLEGVDVHASAAFEAWLLAERRHLAGLSAAVLREAAMAKLAAGAADEAVALGTRLIAFDEYDEEAHALLARAFVAAGSIAEARRHVESAAERIRAELGTEPT